MFVFQMSNVCISNDAGKDDVMALMELIDPDREPE